MTIYIDSDYKCHVSAAAGFTPTEIDAFNGKCPEWIESFRFVPDGETWTRKDGEVFKGKMLTPWKDLGEAYTAQTVYLEQRLAASQYEAINEEHAGTLDDPIPFVQPMEIFKDKYYSQNGKVYLGTRDSGKPLAFDLADLVGLYVTEVTE